MTDFSLPGESAVAATPETTWKLAKEEELRIEIDGRQPDNKVVIKLLSGTAELFGTELQLEKEYTFSPTPSKTITPTTSATTSSSSATADDDSTTMRFAIFTWHGCELKIKGQIKAPYPQKKSDTPMINYINAHAALENLRQLAKQQQRKSGPRTMIVGNQLTGKSTLCRILLSYAVRAGNKPLFIDLDVAANAISVPGTISATSIEQPISVEMSADMGGGGGSSNTLSIKSPLTYFYGHTSPSTAPALYEKLLDKMASVVERRMVEHAITNTSGFIMNTSDWVSPKPGSPQYELLVSIAKKFSIDVILVLDYEELTDALKMDQRLLDQKVTVAKLPKSSGVPGRRDDSFRKQSQERNIKEYFYGSNFELTPHDKTLHWKEIELYRVGSTIALPASALPIGAKPITDPLKLRKEQPNKLSLERSILALSYAKEATNLLTTNVAGFVHVVEVDEVKKTITIKTPAPGPLPNNIFLLGSIKTDSNKL